MFPAALLNFQPIRFYQPFQIEIDVQKDGVEVLQVDVNIFSSR